MASFYSFLYKFFFRLHAFNIPGRIYCLYLKLRGLSTHSVFGMSVSFVWPHKVTIGSNTTLENNIQFKYDGPYSPGKAITIGDHTFIGSCCEFNIKQNITIGNNVLIASGCRFIDHDHQYKKGELIRIQENVMGSIVVKDNAWIGANSVILKNVIIEEGAVIAAGSVVRTNIPAYEIWGGIPAKFIKKITEEL